MCLVSASACRYCGALQVCAVVTGCVLQVVRCQEERCRYFIRHTQQYVKGEHGCRAMCLLGQLLLMNEQAARASYNLCSRAKNNNWIGIIKE